MGAVSEMEVLMISVLEENHSQSPLPGECRFYDSNFHKSEVTSAHTVPGNRNPVMCVLWEFIRIS